MAVGTRCADHVTPLYPQKLALTSPTGGGRSVGIVRVRTKATEFSFSLDTLISQIYFWNKTLRISDSSSVHHQELFTVHTANLYDIHHCCVYSKKIRMIDRGTVRNM